MTDTASRSIDQARLSPTTYAMFSILGSDGGWHEYSRLQTEGALAMIAATPEAALARGVAIRVKRGKVISDNLSEDERLSLVLSGARDRARNNLMIAMRSGRLERQGDLYRMVPETYLAWQQILEDERVALATPMDIDFDPTKVRVFAGMSETEAFLKYPIELRDRVSFRTDNAPTRIMSVITLAANWQYFHDQSSGLTRIEGPCHHGRIIAAEIEEWGVENGLRPYDIRIKKNVKSRDSRDLPMDFMNELVTFYQPFLAARLRPVKATLDLRIPDPDDQIQQMFEWILAAVREYDETKSVPFGAFLVTRTLCRVHDLERGRLGRTMADAQNARSKAIAVFVQENGQPPSAAETAAMMDMTLTAYRELAATLDRAAQIHSADSVEEMLIEGSPALSMSTTEDASAPLHDRESRALMTAALVNVCMPTGGAPLNMAAFGGLYFQNYCGLTKQDTSQVMGMGIQTLNNHAAKARPAIRELLAEV